MERQAASSAPQTAQSLPSSPATSLSAEGADQDMLVSPRPHPCTLTCFLHLYGFVSQHHARQLPVRDQELSGRAETSVGLHQIEATVNCHPDTQLLTAVHVSYTAQHAGSACCSAATRAGAGSSQAFATRCRPGHGGCSFNCVARPLLRAIHRAVARGPCTCSWGHCAAASRLEHLSGS